MNIKKVMALMGSIMILGAALVFADDSPQNAPRNAFRNKVKSEFQAGPFFVDENGDGICDFARDHDNDGVPNCQDPDWIKPQDGSGYKGRFGEESSSNRFGNKNGFRGGDVWNNQSSRQNRRNFGDRICDGLGPKGNGSRRGQGQG